MAALLDTCPLDEVHVLIWLLNMKSIFTADIFHFHWILWGECSKSAECIIVVWEVLGRKADNHQCCWKSKTSKCKSWWKHCKHISCAVFQEKLNFSFGTMSTIVHSKLGFSKICVCWVSTIWMDNNKTQRIVCSLSFPLLYSAKGSPFLEHIVTGDETDTSPKWVFMEWKPWTNKFTPIAGKVIEVIFWYSQGILYVEFMQRRAIIITASYCETLWWLWKMCHMGISNMQHLW